jgi:DNA-binding transcriptional regulator YiaG
MTGEELKILRGKNKLTQKKLAEILRVSLTSVKQWETNIAPIPNDREYYIKIILRLIPLPEL